MGGGAFAQAYAPGEPTLRTPRMSPEEYKRVRDSTIKQLQDLLPDATIAALIEAPEKVDYGDLDIFIAADECPDLVEVAKHLGAAGIILHTNRKATLAIAKTEDGKTQDKPVITYKHWQGKGACPSESLSDHEYAQLDIEVVSPGKLEWFVFYSSYSDLAGLIGHIVTQLGFTVSDTGFWLRLPELDLGKSIPNTNVADRDGMIFLSSDPKAVIKFLGCSVETYDSGFQTIQALYEWLGACRLLSPEAVKIKRNNSHERNREQKRTLYSRFFNEWLPTRMDMTATSQDETATNEKVQLLRTKYLLQAVDFFSVRDECSHKHAALTLAISNGRASNLLKPMIAAHSEKEGKQLGEVIRAFRRHVTFDEAEQPCVVSEPHSDAESELHRFLGADGVSLKDAHAANEWIRAHWQEVRALERQRGKPVS